MTDAMNPYLDSHQDRCILEELAKDQRSGPIVYFVMDLKNLKYESTARRFRFSHCIINETFFSK